MTLHHRLMGILPLGFFFVQLHHHWSHGAAGNMLWMCNISNLILALGILFNIPLLIRVSGYWLIVGLPLWLIDLWQFGDKPIATFCVHIGGLVVAVSAIKQIGLREVTWGYAFGWFLIVQQLSRLLTAPQLNVNLAHSSRGLTTTLVVESYVIFWFLSSLFLLLALWLTEQLLGKFITGRGNRRTEMPAL